jgi:acyl-coenzyme A thioesterase PaaI-like protein
VATTIRALWDRLSTLPAGQWMFARALGRIVPYTGSIGAVVRELGPGHARIEMRDRRKVRNHLRSVHAIALANLAEVTTGLPLAYGVQPKGRAILVSLTVDYLKKARGTLTATSDFLPPDASRDGEIEIPVEVRDVDDVIVTRARVRWRYGPVRERSA